MVEVGVDPLTAITAATRTAADLLDLPQEGSVREGGMADLLLVQGDPLRDIAAVARKANHVAVYKRGKLVA